jgi:sigma-54 dependent transcriptional regulator, acetoin dehydrogenase operon transcriptional activator AcoR
MRTVTLVAGSETTRRQIESQLAEYLDGESEVQVRGYSLERSLPAPLRPAIDGEGQSLILLTSSLVRDELIEAGFLDPDLPVIVAERTVNPQHLDLVVALSPGTKVLFVNDEEETARDCVEALKALGLDELDYVLWYPGCPEPDARIEIAITPGESTLVPPGPSRIIDLGARVLDFATLAEFLDRLGLLERRIGKFSRRYLTKIVQVAQRLARSTEEAQRLNAHLKGVLDSLSRGILVYDAGGRISVCNENLRSLLNIRSRDRLALTLPGVVRNRQLLDFLENPHADGSGVFRLADRDLVVRRFETAEGTVAIFQDAEEDASEARLGLEYRKRGYVAKYDMDDIVGVSPSIQRARRIADRLAATDLTILINGESGTGKELFASAIHAGSSRRSGPFLAVDFGSLSDDLIESELFGYADGAFTGARKGGKPGLFELADGGTIFLDEIGHVSAKVQNRLLRVLQEKEVLRVGGAEIKRIDVRVIAASNEDLLERARRGAFREDLYFRLKTGLLRIPPLRERLSDIPLLIESFLRAEGQAGVTVDPELLLIFADYSWPGNVRELRNLVTYMLAVKEGPSIAICDLPDEGFFEGLSRPDGSCAGATGASPRSAGPARESGLSELDNFLLGAVSRLQQDGRGAGRASLARLAAESGLGLSPAMVRSRLSSLALRGLVVSGRGRRGTRISPAGKMAIE